MSKSWGAFCVAILATLTACSDGTASAEPVEPVFASAVQEAQAAGASDTQIAILERLSKEGKVEIDDVREALEGTYACLDAAGISHTEEIQANSAGVQYVVYDMRAPVGLGADAGAAISDECANTHSRFVEDLYFMQPQVVAMQDEYQATVVVPALVACYEEYDMALDEDLTNDQRWDDAFFIVTGSPGVRPGDPTFAGCLYDVMVNVA